MGIGATNGLKDALKALPDPLARKLLIGSTGRTHLLECGLMALSAAGDDPGLIRPGADMLASALGENPLSGETAATLAGLPRTDVLLGKPVAELARTIAASWQRPDNLSYYIRLASKRDLPRLKSYLTDRFAEEPGNLFWREQGLALALFEADHDFALQCIDAGPVRALGPVWSALMSQAAYLRGDFAQAFELAGSLDGFGPGFKLLRQSEALLASGRRDQGTALLQASLIASPWRTQAALRLHDIVTDLDRGTADLGGTTLICLYSWNKANDLDATLSALHASDLGTARLVVLNNGSTDRTPEMLDAWADRFGPDKFLRIDLPVNVGAAAARNWLMHTDEACEADWLIYLDDDAIVPADWLGKFGASVRAMPDAGVWGCKVVDDAQPALLQGVDFHYQPFEDVPPGPDLSSIQPNPVRFANLHVQGLDFGQFDYLRPCASVTGCCHLFRADRLRKVGDFSLMLMPSQYDDMERDLRMNRAKMLAGYQGHLAVRHKKRTGQTTLAGGVEGANALGNRYKMQVMHPREELEQSAAMELQALEDDLSRKLDRLENGGP